MMYEAVKRQLCKDVVCFELRGTTPTKTLGGAPWGGAWGCILECGGWLVGGGGVGGGMHDLAAAACFLRTLGGRSASEF